MNDLLEILESREAVLTKHISEDEKCTPDRVLGRFYEGRIVIEKHWLDETRKLIEYIKRSK